MGRGINIALVNGNVTSRPKPLAVGCSWECFAAFAALKHSWEAPAVGNTHISQINWPLCLSSRQNRRTHKDRVLRHVGRRCA